MRTRIAWLLSLGSAACSPILGVDDYATETPSPSNGGTGQTSDALPVVPALLSEDVRSTCEPCLVQNCATEYAACKASARCRELLRCEAMCKDPSCLANCETDHPSSPAFDDYFACAFGTRFFTTTTLSSCPEECHAGKNWDCVADYEWRGPAKASLEFADVTLYDTAFTGTPNPFSPFANMQIASCGDSLVNPLVGNAGCGTPVTVTSAGTARVALDAGTLFALMAPERRRFYERPIVRSGPAPLALMPRVFWEATARTLPDFDPTLGVVEFLQYDCLRENAIADVHLAKPDDRAGRLYWVGFALPDLNSQYGTGGALFNVPLGQQIEIESANADGPRARRNVTVSRGWTTDVALFPLTSSEAGR